VTVAGGDGPGERLVAGPTGLRMLSFRERP